MRNILVLFYLSIMLIGMADCNNQNITLTGCWHDNPTMGSVHGDLYSFSDNGIFVYATALGDRTERIRLSTGNWWIKENTLYLSATHLLVIEGGAITENAIEQKYIDGGALTVREIPSNEQITEAFPIKTIQDDTYWDDTIMLGDDLQLWRKDGEVTPYMLYFRDNHLVPADYPINK